MGDEQRDVDELREEIVAIILRGTDDFFDAPEDRAEMEGTVHACCKFFDFLRETQGETPDPSEANFILGTIRAHMDEYFTMGQWGRILSGLKLKEGFSGKLPQTFGELKTEYEAIFQRVLECDVSAKAFGLLLSLTKLMLLFSTAYFQSFESYSSPDGESGV
jgi:hypothetical protein